MARGQVIKVDGKDGAAYAIRFYDQNGKRRYKTVGKRKGDAERALRQVMGKVDRGEFRAIPDISFKELAHKWLEMRKNQVRLKAFASYQAHVERLIKVFGIAKVKNISSEDIEKFSAQLLGEKLAAATTGRTITLLKSIFEKGIQWGYLSNNPARHIKKPKAQKKEMEFLNPDELRLVLKHTDKRYKTLMITACYTGMRQSEILGLQWGDIDFESGKIYVRRTLQQGQFYEPKTHSSRRAVIIPQILVEALKVHRTQQSVELEENEHDLVFTNTKGRPIDGRNLTQRVFEPALKRAGLRKVGFHALRHSYVSLLLSQGESIKFISRQVGHSSAKLTLDVYSHIMEGAEEEAMERLQERLQGQSPVIA